MCWCFWCCLSRVSWALQSRLAESLTKQPNYRNRLGRGFWPHRLPSLCFSLPGISVSSPKLGTLFSALSVIIEVCHHLSEHTVVKMTVRSSPDISNPLDIALKLQQVAVKLRHFAVLAFSYSLIKLPISLILRRRCGKISSMHCLLRIAQLRSSSPTFSAVVGTWLTILVRLLHCQASFVLPKVPPEHIEVLCLRLSRCSVYHDTSQWGRKPTWCRQRCLS